MSVVAVKSCICTMTSKLEFKTDLLHQAPEKICTCRLWKLLRLDQPLACRNPSIIEAKLQIPNSKVSKGQVKAGLYAQNSHYLVELKDCLVQDKETQTIANRIAELLTYYQIPITDERKILGVRTIMVRRARKTGQVQIIIVANRQLNLTNLWKT